MMCSLQAETLAARNTGKKYYTIKNLSFLDIVSRETQKTVKYKYCSETNTTEKIYTYDIICSFDIETSNFYQNAKKVALMYVWQVCINGFCVVGRTWEEFTFFIETLSQKFKTDTQNRLVIYVHNLGFEFEFIRKIFEWESVFAIESRKPAYALTVSGIEFRCSYLLSGSSLDTVAKNLTMFKIEKLEDFDYNKIRHCETDLTEREIEYCLNDVKIVVCYIYELTTKYTLSSIPLTKTGFVREYVKQKCFKVENGTKKQNKIKKYNYLQYIHNKTLSVEEYSLCKRAYSGGFTHCNALYNDEIVKDVYSYDFTSSYPAVMVSEKFPCSSPERIKIESVEHLHFLMKTYSIIFTVRFYNLKSTCDFENYISKSRCEECSNVICDNGRIESADYVKITITETDFKIIEKMYSWEDVKFTNGMKFFKTYLPKPIIQSVIDFYKNKTILKGVEGSELDYLLAKQNLNSIYGCFVMDIVREQHTYTDVWKTKKITDLTESEILDQIEKYNNSNTRFSYYVWGVYITAYARYNLFTAIFELKDDYIYSDTDSVKFINYEKHEKYFADYNNMIVQKIEKCLQFNDIAIEGMRPKNQKGEEKQLGVWDFEGCYKNFKTLGAKRYIYQTQEDKYCLTCAGLPKSAINYIIDISKKENTSVFELFTYDKISRKGMLIPAEHANKLTHTYIDDIRKGYVSDYQGKTVHYKALSGVHLEQASFELSLSAEYAEYLTYILNEGIVQ